MTINMNVPTIAQAVTQYIQMTRRARAAHTARSYKNGLEKFCEILIENDIDINNTKTTDLSEDYVLLLIDTLNTYSPATERLYLTAVYGFYEYLSADNIAEINLPRIKLLIHQRARRPGIRLPQFPRQDIEKVIAFAEALQFQPSEDPADHLRNLRDRAFILTLADTGLRVHEACALRRGDLDWNEQKAVVLGKGNTEAIVRFSRRSIRAIKDYLSLRAELDGKSGKTLSSLPLFARHDRGAGKKLKGITPTTGRDIVAERVRQALGIDAEGRITPHSFRHYFVTVVLRASGGNLKLAQLLARHRNIAVTQRYAHLSDNELDKDYSEIFDNTD